MRLSKTNLNFSLNIFILAIFTNFHLNCNPLNLNNSSDSGAKDYLLTEFLRNFRFTQYFTYTTKLVAETGVLGSRSSVPDRSDLLNCRPVSNLPTGWTLHQNGTVSASEAPTHTQAPSTYKILCGTPNFATIAEGEVSIEVKGLDWVKNLTATGTGLESNIVDVGIFNKSEIYFLGSFINNSSNIASDFGSVVTKQSYPTAGTSSSPIVIKLNEKGELLSTRVLGGTEPTRITLDDLGNQYILANYTTDDVLANPDSDFGGNSVIKNGAYTVNNFLFHRINYDGTFQYAKIMDANTLSSGHSLCYSKANNRMYIGGRVNGSTNDIGFDFGTSDPHGSATAFLLEVSTDGSYFTSRKFTGSTHQPNFIKCNADGSYSIAIWQVANSLDYRIPYDGINDIKSTNNLGTGITRIAPGNSYQFTKTIYGGGSNLPPSGFDMDSDGNMVVGVYGNQTSVDLRIGIDGISEIKNTAGGNDAYIIKVSSTGAYFWGKRIGGTEGDFINAISIRPSDGQIFVLMNYGNGGSSSQTLFSDIESSLVISRIGSNANPYIVEIDKNTGNFKNFIPIAISTGYTPFNSMAFDSEENLYLAGQFRESTKFQYSTTGKSISKSYPYGNNSQGVFMKIRP